MVSRITRKQIVYLLFGCIFLSCVFLLTFVKTNDAVNVYSATNNEMDLAVIDGIFKADKKDLEYKDIKAVIVPHHLVASEAIALGVRSLVAAHPHTVVLISPDHYFVCQSLFCTSKGKYTTFFGDVSMTNEQIDYLLKSSDLIKTTDKFENEHGIYSIVPFIKYYLPDAQVVPIIVSQKTRGSAKSREEIVMVLKKLLIDESTVLIVSSDFSHYLPLDISNNKDILTKKTLCSGNTDELLRLENPDQSDCPLCLWLLSSLAKSNNFFNPAVVSHTNSANLLNDITVKQTTSHFTFVFSKKPNIVNTCGL